MLSFSEVTLGSCCGANSASLRGGPYRQHRTRRDTDDALGDAAHREMVPTAAAVRSADNQIDVVAAHVFEEFVARIAPSGGHNDATIPQLCSRHQLLEPLPGFSPKTIDSLEELGTRCIASPGLAEGLVHDMQEVKR